MNAEDLSSFCALSYSRVPSGCWIAQNKRRNSKNIAPNSREDVIIFHKMMMKWGRVCRVHGNFHFRSISKVEECLSTSLADCCFLSEYGDRIILILTRVHGRGKRSEYDVYVVVKRYTHTTKKYAYNLWIIFNNDKLNYFLFLILRNAPHVSCGFIGNVVRPLALLFQPLCRHS